MIDEKKLEREDLCDICGDNSFKIINEAKQALIDSTNINTSPDEMAVLDDILFRCWQMGWIDKYGDKKANGWIPCNERLPKDGETYLITNAESFEQYRIYMGWYDGIKGIWHMEGNFERKMNVIAWMPLPEPYKEKISS